MNNKPEKIIFSISGGVGKNIMATSVASSIKKQFPDSELIIATPHTFVWKNNPNVSKIINFVEDENFYKKEISGQNILYFGNDPYLTKEFIYKEKHLNQIWCEMFGIEFDNSLPKLYFTQEENEKVKNMLPIDKPIFMFQISGGAENQEFPISWMRDLPLPIIEKVVSEMNKRGYRSIQIRRPNQYAVAGADYLSMSLRDVLCSLQFSEKRLLIDSVAQHGAIALELKSVVCWIGNKPEIFGYKENTNIISKATHEFRHDLNNYLEPWNITGALEECPFNTNELFDVEEILKNLLD
jgi:hypothetical protein